MAKIIVTHHHPDLDAIMSVWLLVRFDQPNFGDAALAFVQAPLTYKGQVVDSDKDIVHVDVGGGRFDHHKPGGFATSAARLVWEDLVAQGLVSPTDLALRQMTEVGYEIDTFADCYWEEAGKPRAAFALHEILPALHRLQIYDNEAVTRLGFTYLDAVYQRLKDYQRGKEAINEGQEFVCAWGRGIVVETAADDVSKIAQKMGYDLVLIHDTEHGYLKIKTAPKVEKSLEDLYVKICERESAKRWVYHNSGHMLFSGSDKGKLREPTELTVSDLMRMIKEVFV